MRREVELITVEFGDNVVSSECLARQRDLPYRGINFSFPAIIRVRIRGRHADLC
jgi:hypothetical protein